MTGRRGRGRRKGLIGAVLGACLALVIGVVVASAHSGQGGGTLHLASGGATSSTSARSSSGTATVGMTGSPSASGTASASASASNTPITSKSAATSSETTATGATPVPGAGWRILTMVNDLSQTIWPAVAADPKHPISATGWVLAPGASLTILIPDHWDVRVWARTGCDFDSAGYGSCVTGDCSGKFQCGSTWGQMPSTLAEFNLNAWDGMDFYDVSLVEGNNLPMWVNSFGGSSTDKISPNGCVAAGCTQNANTICPSALQRVHDGTVVACLSACLALGGDQMCCTGAWSSRAACNPSNWPVDSAAVFKKAEPFAYSYVDDDATSVLTCTGECDYRITWGVSRE